METLRTIVELQFIFEEPAGAHTDPEAAPLTSRRFCHQINRS